METINDLMNFLNQMDIYNIVSGVELSTFNTIRKILIEEFRDIDLDKLVEILLIIDDLYIEYLKNKVQFDKSIISTLRDKIFNLYNQNLVNDE